MRSLVIATVAVSLLLASLPSLGVAAASTLKHMTFWENNSTETAGFTTLNFEASDAATLVAQKAAGLDNLMATFDFFIEPTSQGYLLRSDWPTRWAAAKAIAQPLFANGTIFGFFLGDELVWNGLNVSSLLTYAAAVRQDFPSATIWYNEAVPPMQSGTTYYGQHVNYTIPVTIDWISIDMYHNAGPSASFVKTYVQPFYQQYVYPKMQANQSAVLVPGSFASAVNPACNASCYDVMCAIDAQNFYQWAISDPKIVALAPWHWNNCNGCQPFKDEIGTAYTNQTKQAWIDIGHQIRAAWRHELRSD